MENINYIYHAKFGAICNTIFIAQNDYFSYLVSTGSINNLVFRLGKAQSVLHIQSCR